MTLCFENFRAIASKSNFTIWIYIDDGTDNYYYPRAMKLGAFFYGSKEIIDSIMYPDNVDFQFSIAKSVVPFLGTPDPFSTRENTKAEYETEYFRIIRLLKTKYNNVQILKDGTRYFAGYVDKANIIADFITKSFTFSFISNIIDLKNINPQYTTLGYDVYSETKATYSEIIEKIIKLINPDLQNVEFYSNIKSLTTYSFMGQPWVAGAQYFGDYINNYFGHYSLYSNMYDLLREILNIIGAVGVMIGNIYYVCTRGYYSDITTKSLQKGVKPPVMNSYQNTVKGLCTKVRTGPVSNVFYTVNNGDISDTGDGDIETIILSAAGGMPPQGIVARNIWIYVPEYVAGLGNGQWVNSVVDSFFTDKLGAVHTVPLWKIVNDTIWSVCSNGRGIYNITVSDAVKPNDFYKFDNDKDIYRIKSMKPDYCAGTTDLELIRANYYVWIIKTDEGIGTTTRYIQRRLTTNQTVFQSGFWGTNYNDAIRLSPGDISGYLIACRSIMLHDNTVSPGTWDQRLIDNLIALEVEN
jgi:hypothetical protein